jgi:hypothetical protein
MDDPWTVERLAEASGEPADRLMWYAEAGLLGGEGPDTFGADSIHRLRLIGYAHQRGISDEELAQTTKEQGDLLGIFHDLNAEGSATRDLALAARAAGIPDDLFTELAGILAVEDTAAASDDDVAAIDLLGRLSHPGRHARARGCPLHRPAAEAAEGTHRAGAAGRREGDACLAALRPADRSQTRGGVGRGVSAGWQLRTAGETCFYPAQGRYSV